MQYTSGSESFLVFIEETIFFLIALNFKVIEVIVSKSLSYIAKKEKNSSVWRPDKYIAAVNVHVYMYFLAVSLTNYCQVASATVFDTAICSLALT